jgi:hypothetical protein
MGCFKSHPPIDLMIFSENSVVVKVSSILHYCAKDALLQRINLAAVAATNRLQFFEQQQSPPTCYGLMTLYAKRTALAL